MHDHCRSNVSVEIGTAFAAVPSLGERFLGNGPALRAGLGSPARIDLDQFDTSIRSFVSEVGDDLRPRGVADVLGEHSARQAFDVEVLDGDAAETVDQIAADLVAEVPTLIGDTGMVVGERDDAFAPGDGTSLAPRNGALAAAQPLRAALGESGAAHCLAVGKRDEAGQPEVDADAIGPGAVNGINLDMKDDVPPARLSRENGGLGLGREIAMPDSAYLTGDADEAELAVLADGHAVADAEVCRMIAIPRPEAWEPRLVAALDARKEGFERPVQPAHDLLLGGAGPTALPARIVTANRRQGGILLVAGNRDAVPVSRDPVFKRGVVEAAKVGKHVGQSAFLRFARLDPKFVGEYQISGSGLVGSVSIKSAPLTLPGPARSTFMAHINPQCKKRTHTVPT